MEERLLGAGLPKRAAHTTPAVKRSCQALRFAEILPEIRAFPRQRLTAHCTVSAQSKENTFSLVKDIENEQKMQAWYQPYLSISLTDILEGTKKVLPGLKLSLNFN